MSDKEDEYKIFREKYGAAVHTSSDMEHDEYLDMILAQIMIAMGSRTVSDDVKKTIRRVFRDGRRSALDNAIRLLENYSGAK